MKGKFRMANELEQQDDADCDDSPLGVSPRIDRREAADGRRRDARARSGPQLSQASRPGRGDLRDLGQGGAVGRPGERILSPGDAAFIPAGMVHASFNAGEATRGCLRSSALASAIGFETIEMSGEAPWNGSGTSRLRCRSGPRRSRNWRSARRSIAAYMSRVLRLTLLAPESSRRSSTGGSRRSCSWTICWRGSRRSGGRGVAVECRVC